MTSEPLAIFMRWNEQHKIRVNIEGKEVPTFKKNVVKLNPVNGNSSKWHLDIDFNLWHNSARFMIDLLVPLFVQGVLVKRSSCCRWLFIEKLISIRTYFMRYVF